MNDLQSATAALRKFKVDFEKQHCCSICEQVLLDPVSLSCGHVFDAKCIREMVAEVPGSTARCPTCSVQLSGSIPMVCTVIQENVETKYPKAVEARRKELLRASLDLQRAVLCEYQDRQDESIRKRSMDLAAHFFEPQHALCQHVRRALQQERDIERLRSVTVASLEEGVRVLQDKLREAKAEGSLERMRDMALTRINAEGNAFKIQMMAVHLSVQQGAEVNLAYENGDTPLLQAVYDGNTSLARVLLAAGANPNQGLPGSGVTPLYTAALAGHAPVTQVLLAAGANPSQATKSDGSSPLHAAASEGCQQIVQMLLEAGADVNQASLRGGTPLDVALEGRKGWNLNVVRMLLDAGADPKLCTVQNTARISPLGVAALCGWAGTAQALVQDKYLDVNEGVTSIQATPLFLACHSGHREVVKILLRVGADPCCTTIDTFCSGASPMHMAAQEGHAAVVKELIAGGADVNQARVVDGDPPMMIAAAAGHLEVVRTLLEAGAKPNLASSKTGATSLHSAVSEGRVEVVHMLLKAGADANQKRKYDGATPLHLAAVEGRASVVKALLSAGADINQGRTDIGATPLYVASQKGHTHVMQLLLEAGADVNRSRADDGYTPLYVAVFQGNSKVVQMLVEAGADVDKRCTDSLYGGLTPLYLAAQKGNAEMVQLLIEAGADTQQGAGDGTTPLTIATRKGHAQAALLLKTVTM